MDSAGGSLRAALTDRLLEHWATVDIVEESPFKGVSFFAPGSEELAVSEAITRLASQPSHLIGLCTNTVDRPWQLSESLLVPTGNFDDAGATDGELSAWVCEVERLGAKVAGIARERDELRERQMAVQDRAERMETIVARQRKDVERYLRQVSDDAAARELLLLEREQGRRALATSQSALAKATQELDKLRASVRALGKEVARLRAARGTGQGTGAGSAGVHDAEGSTK
jgi:hypothetical protein